MQALGYAPQTNTGSYRCAVELRQRKVVPTWTQLDPKSAMKPVQPPPLHPLGQVSALFDREKVSPIIEVYHDVLPNFAATYRFFSCTLIIHFKCLRMRVRSIGHLIRGASYEPLPIHGVGARSHFLSSSSDKLRPGYGTLLMHWPRQLRHLCAKHSPPYRTSG